MQGGAGGRLRRGHEVWEGRPRWMGEAGWLFAKTIFWRKKKTAAKAESKGGWGRVMGRPKWISRGRFFFMIKIATETIEDSHSGWPPPRTFTTKFYLCENSLRPMPSLLSTEKSRFFEQKLTAGGILLEQFFRGKKRQPTPSQPLTASSGGSSAWPSWAGQLRGAPCQFFAV